MSLCKLTMITLLGIALATHLKYEFPLGQRIPYAMSVKFKGHIPILGGQEGTVEVSLKFSATGQAPDPNGNAQVKSEIEELKMVFNGATLPLGVKNVQTFFPPTTISLTPEGQVLKTDAPDVTLPVQLPGLNAKRFPDISYVPIQFPVDGVEVGKTFTFKKAFGASQVEYVVSPTKIDDSGVELDVSMAQDYAAMEDDRHNPTKSDSDAAFRLSTHVTGRGTAFFDRKRGLVTIAHIAADAKTHVIEVKSKAESDRDLKTELDLKASN